MKPKTILKQLTLLLLVIIIIFIGNIITTFLIIYTRDPIITFQRAINLTLIVVNKILGLE
jgi:hypothetical protein